MLGLSNLRSKTPQGDEKNLSEILAIEYPDPGSPELLPMEGQSDEIGFRTFIHSSHADSLSLSGGSINNLEDPAFDDQSDDSIDESNITQQADLFDTSEGHVARTVCYPEYTPSENAAGGISRTVCYPEDKSSQGPVGTAPQTVCYAEYDPNRDNLVGGAAHTTYYNDESKTHKSNRGMSNIPTKTTVRYGDLSSHDKYSPLKPHHGGFSKFGDLNRPSIQGTSGPKLLEWPGSSSRTSGGRINLESYVQEIRARFASSLPGGLPGSISTLDEVQKRMNNLRLRMMPHRGSQLDRILHRAEGLAESIHGFLAIVQTADPAAAECSHLVMTSFKYLTYLISKGATFALEKAFTVFDQAAIILGHLGQHNGVRSSIISELLVKALVVVIDLDLEVLQALKSSPGDSSQWNLAFGSRFDSHIKRLLQIEEEFSLEVWRLTIEGTSYSSQGIGLETIRGWLSSESISGPTTKFHGFFPSEGLAIELPLKWLSSLTSKFWQSNKSTLFITGEAGCGKSGLVRSLLDRSKAPYARGTKVLYFSVEPSPRGPQSSTNVVKSLLLQLFDQTLGNADFFKLLCDAYIRIEKRGESNGESLLWSILRQQAMELGLKQSSTELLIVIDALDKIEGGKIAAVKVRTQIHQVVSQNQRFRCIILCRPIFDDDDDDDDGGYDRGKFGPDTLGDDIRHFLRISIQKSTRLTFLTKQEMSTVITRALQCSLESFVAAKFFIALIEMQQSYQKIMVAIQTIPNTVLGLIDRLIMQINFEDPQVKNVMSWMLASQRIMTLQEIEMMTDVSFAAGSLSHDNASHFFRTSCASLVEVVGNRIQFTHPSVKDHLTKLGNDSTISLGLTSAHKIALRRSLEYIKLQLHDMGEGMPVFDVSGSSLDKGMRNHIEDNHLLEYCILYYLSHYRESRIDTITTDFKTVWTDSPQVAQCEWHYWHLQVTGIPLEERLQQALKFRRSIFGSRSRSVIQTLINLSVLHISSSQQLKALPYLGEAWSLALEQFGKNASICRQLALKYSEILSIQSTTEFSFNNWTERLFEFLWSIEQERFGAMDDRATVHVNILIDLYKQKNKHENLAKLLRQLYRECVIAFGKFDTRTISYAEQLIDVLTVLGRHNEIGSLCEELFAGVGGSLDIWDHRRLVVLFRLIDWYVSQGRHINAEEQLRSSWQILYDLVIVKQSLEARLALIKVTARFGNLLIKGRQREEAAQIVTQLWAALQEAKSSFSDAILKELLSLSEEYVEVHIYEAVIPILVQLRTIYSGRMNMSCHVEAVRVSIALSKCYKDSPHLGDETSSLQDLLESILAMNIIDEHCVDLAAELVETYVQQSNWHGATLVCHTVLERLWHELVHFDGHTPGIPEEGRWSAVKMALIYARVLVKQESVTGAFGTLQFIFSSFRKDLSIDSDFLFEAAQIYSDLLQTQGRVREAISIWLELRSACVERFGSRNDQYFRLTQMLITLYKISESSHGSEDISVLIDIINSFGYGPGLCQSSCLEAVLILISSFEAQGKLDEVRTWYQRLWGSITVHHRSGDISQARIFSTFERYTRLLISIRQHAEAIKTCRDLRTLFRCDFGVSVYSVRVDFELAKLLEIEEGRYHEAVTIYEEICRIQIDDFEEHGEILAIIHAATEQLAILYARHSDLEDKAEAALCQAWEYSKRIKGCSHAQTYSCFEKLMNFYRKKETRTANALERIAGFVVDVLLEEREDSRLFQLAKSFSQLYHSFGAAKMGIRLLRELRSELACVGSVIIKSPKLKTARIGRSRCMLIDRRCFILINTMEDLLEDKSRPALFTDIVQGLLTEIALYEAWSNVNRVPCSLQLRLAASSRLTIFLQDRKRQYEYEVLREEAWAVFRSHTDQNLSQTGVIWTFFQKCLEDMGRRHQSVPFVERLTEACVELHRTRCFKGCLALAEWAKDYFEQDTWGSSTKEIIRIGINFARQVRAKTFETSEDDHEIIIQIEKVISGIMVGIFNRGGKSKQPIDFGGLSPEEVNIIIKYFGHDNNLSMLEQIFQSLWDSRVAHDKWHASTTVSIGLRLCEVKFALGDRTKANELIEDMLYNLRDVHGPLHPLTLQCENLRARFFNRQGQHHCALDIHRNLLEEALRRQVHDHHSDSGIGSTPYDLTSIMLEQTRYLKAAYEFNGGWDHHGADHYLPILERIFRFGSQSHRQPWNELGKPSAWEPVCRFKKGDLDALDIESAESAGSSGFWKPPTEWTIVEAQGETEMFDDFSDDDNAWHHEERFSQQWAPESETRTFGESKELVLHEKSGRSEYFQMDESIF